ncbi:unnamed protein product, partial [Amoebophrya sp. A25]|eukprot:GSA25T00019535001.1
MRKKAKDQLAEIDKKYTTRADESRQSGAGLLDLSQMRAGEDQKHEIKRGIEETRLQAAGKEEVPALPEEKDSWPLAKAWDRFFAYDSLISDKMWDLLTACGNLVPE